MTIDQTSLQGIVDLCRMCFDFGLVRRVTHHPDGQTLETDTTHTVMLSIVCCAYAERYAPHLDLGLISQFSSVHDLPEVRCGDTDTRGMDEAGLAAKEAREAGALEQIARETATLPWVARTLRKYESMNTPEARFVRTIDKVLPKVSRILNAHARGPHSREDLAQSERRNAAQLIKISAQYASDQPEALELYCRCHDLMMDALRAANPGWLQ